MSAASGTELHQNWCIPLPQVRLSRPEAIFTSLARYVAQHIAKGSR